MNAGKIWSQFLCDLMRVTELLTHQIQLQVCLILDLHEGIPKGQSDVAPKSNLLIMIISFLIIIFKCT